MAATVSERTGLGRSAVAVVARLHFCAMMLSAACAMSICVDAQSIGHAGDCASPVCELDLALRWLIVSQSAHA